MTAIDDRLAGCFTDAFPELAPEDFASAAVDTVAAWDSLRALVLVALLEETFNVRIPARDYPELRSYAAIRDYLGAITDGPA